MHNYTNQRDKPKVLLVCGLVCSRCVDTFTLLFAPKTDQKNRPLV